MKKRIRLTIEWDGACSEGDWARVMVEELERVDMSRAARVTQVELLTNFGTTSMAFVNPYRRFRYWLRIRRLPGRALRN